MTYTITRMKENELEYHGHQLRFAVNEKTWVNFMDLLRAIGYSAWGSVSKFIAIQPVDPKMFVRFRSSLKTYGKSRISPSPSYYVNVDNLVDIIWPPRHNQRAARELVDFVEDRVLNGLIDPTYPPTMEDVPYEPTEKDPSILEEIGCSIPENELDALQTVRELVKRLDAGIKEQYIKTRYGGLGWDYFMSSINEIDEQLNELVKNNKFDPIPEDKWIEIVWPEEHSRFYLSNYKKPTRYKE